MTKYLNYAGWVLSFILLILFIFTVYGTNANHNAQLKAQTDNFTIISNNWVVQAAQRDEQWQTTLNATLAANDAQWKNTLNATMSARDAEWKALMITTMNSTITARDAYWLATINTSLEVNNAQWRNTLNATLAARDAQWKAIVDALQGT